MSTLGNGLVESSLLWQKALGKRRKERLKEGRLVALRGSLLTVLTARGLRVTEAQRAHRGRGGCLDDRV